MLIDKLPVETLIEIRDRLEYLNRFELGGLKFYPLHNDLSLPNFTLVDSEFKTVQLIKTKDLKKLDRFFTILKIEDFLEKYISKECIDLISNYDDEYPYLDLILYGKYKTTHNLKLNMTDNKGKLTSQLLEGLSILNSKVKGHLRDI